MPTNRNLHTVNNLMSPGIILHRCPAAHTLALCRAAHLQHQRNDGSQVHQKINHKREKLCAQTISLGDAHIGGPNFTSFQGQESGAHLA